MIPKFRAWVKEDKEMWPVHAIVYDNETVWVEEPDDEDPSGCLGFDDVILMQSTGLKDKNNKEIFEGDIITNGIEIADIKNHQTLGFYTVLDDREWFFASGMSVEDFEEYADEFSQIAKIIGNIYENPELLKEQREKENEKNN